MYLFFKEINTFIRQWHITSDSEELYIATKVFLKLSIGQRIQNKMNLRCQHP